MSEHWDPDRITGRRSRTSQKTGLPRPRDRVRSGSAAFNGRELRMMIMIGLAIGLAMFEGSRRGVDQALFGGDAPAGNSVTVVEPGAQARLAQANRERRTNAAAATTARLLRGIVVQPAAVQSIDSGSFEFRGARIRLADIDAPASDGACPYETGLASRAAGRMRALLGAGPFELSEAGGRDEDAQGRKLRIASRDGRSLGGVLVSEGLARPWTGRSLPWCASGLGFL